MQSSSVAEHEHKITVIKRSSEIEFGQTFHLDMSARSISASLGPLPIANLLPIVVNGQASLLTMIWNTLCTLYIYIPDDSRCLRNYSYCHPHHQCHKEIEQDCEVGKQAFLWSKFVHRCIIFFVNIRLVYNLR